VFGETTSGLLSSRDEGSPGAISGGRGVNVSATPNSAAGYRPMSDKAFPLVFAFVEDITQRKQAEEGLATFSRRLIEVQDQERTRTARDLHDHVGQRVASKSRVVVGPPRTT